LKEKAKYNFSTPTAPSSIKNHLSYYILAVHSHKPRGWIKSRFFSFAIKEEEPHDSYATVSFFSHFLNRNLMTRVETTTNSMGKNTLTL
jgi:hypothetical protein